MPACKHILQLPYFQCCAQNRELAPNPMVPAEEHTADKASM